MEKIEGINVERILWCCAARHITQDALARDADINYATLEKLLRGEDSITFNQLSRIADKLGRGVLFFLEESPPVSEKIYSPAFRTLANQKPDLDNTTKDLIERAENQRAVYASLLEEMDDPYSTYKAPPISKEPREAARQARQWLGIGSKNNFASYRNAIEDKGILVFVTNAYNGKWQLPKENPILGFSLYDDELPLIVVKKAQHESRQVFTLAHELAHILINRESVVDDAGDFEKYTGNERIANQFAGHLLVPDELMSQISMAERPLDVAQYDDWLEEFRDAWGVSSEVILLRLLRAGKIEVDEYHDYKTLTAKRFNDAELEKAFGTRMYRHREPRNIFGERYVRSVLDALDRKRISLTRASKFLDGLKVADIRKLEQYCAAH